jgi:NADH-quinone oxidoreductase subunit E
MVQESDKKLVSELLFSYKDKKASIIPVLQAIQKEHRYLPIYLLSYVAKEIGVSEAKIYGIATFYENFSFVPKGKYVVKICDGTACHVRKSIPILDALYNELSLSKKKQTTDDNLFTVETVSCLGACGLAPVITINDKVYPTMTPDNAIEIINSLKALEVS